MVYTDNRYIAFHGPELSDKLEVLFQKDNNYKERYFVLFDFALFSVLGPNCCPVDFGRHARAHLSPHTPSPTICISSLAPWLDGLAGLRRRIFMSCFTLLVLYHMTSLELLLPYATKAPKIGA